MRMTTVSSGRITTQAFTSGEPSAARTTAGPPKGMSRPSARPELSAVLPMTKARRLSVGIWFMVASSGVRGGVNGLAHLLEGAATADVGDGFVNVLVGRLRLVLEQRRHRHDHPALAISALRNVVGDPGLLHLVQGAVVGEPLNGRDLLADGFADRHAAGAHRDAVDVDCTGAALCNAATIFRAGEASILPNSPKQRRIRLDIDIYRFSVDCEVCHRDPLVSPIHRLYFGGNLDRNLEQFKSIIRVCGAA